MSIQTEIDRIRQNIADSYSAVSALGGMLPETQNSDHLSDAIRSIRSAYSFVLSITFADDFLGQPYRVTGGEEHYSGNVPDSLKVKVTVQEAETEYTVTASKADGTSYSANVQTGTAFGVYSVELPTFVWWSPHMTGENTPEPYVVTAGYYQERPANGGGQPWKMWDGNAYTGWLAQADRSLLWNAIDLGEPKLIKGIAMFPNQVYKYLPEWFDLEASDDGINWKFIRKCSGFTGDAAYQRIEFDAPFQARHVKISNVHEHPNINGFAGINEIELLVLRAAAPQEAISSEANEILSKE